MLAKFAVLFFAVSQPLYQARDQKETELSFECVFKMEKKWKNRQTSPGGCILCCPCTRKDKRAACRAWPRIDTLDKCLDLNRKCDD
jgi:hypothetical protein